MSYNLIFLGTGAADRILLEQENTFDDKDKRRCSAALLGGNVLLDCGAHILNSLSVAKISMSSITDVVITHFHSDHFNIEAIKRIAVAAGRKLNLWYRGDAVVSEIENCNLHPMELFKEYDVSGFKITGVPANHEAHPQHLSIEKDGKRLFYGLDGAWFLGDTVRFMQNKKYDTVVFDATVGDYLGDYRMGEHNSIPMIRLLVPSMKTLDIIRESTKIVLSHIAVCLHRSFDEICELTKSDGYIIAYDGLVLEI